MEGLYEEHTLGPEGERSARGCKRLHQYNIPFINSRIDFCIAGYGRRDRGTIVIVELKGRSEGLCRIDMEDIVYANFYDRDVLNPSYQAWSYANYMTNFNNEIVYG